MTNAQKLILQTWVMTQLQVLEEFQKDREKLSNAEQRRTIGGLRAQTLSIYNTGFIQSNGDLETAFGFCWVSFIELQHKTSLFLSI